MSEQYSFSRDDGFVALPVGVFDLDLSPGSFRTLVELCRMANKEGFCWPSLQQLSERLGRSKSAISGYIAQLRDAELIETQTQTTANGYNYRLKYFIPFWPEWRASLGRRTAQKTEHRVQPVERLRDSEKQNDINHCQVDLDKVISAWGRCFKGAPYPALGKTPSAELVAETTAALRDPHAKSQVSPSQISARLRTLWRDLGVTCSDSLLSKHTAQLQARALNDEELVNAAAALAKAWPHHWRNAPTEEAFAKLVKSRVPPSVMARRTVLEGYMRRFERAQKSLRPTPEFCSVGSKENITAAANTPLYPRI